MPSRLERYGDTGRSLTAEEIWKATDAFTFSAVRVRVWWDSIEPVFDEEGNKGELLNVLDDDPRILGRYKGPWHFCVDALEEQPRLVLLGRFKRSRLGDVDFRPRDGDRWMPLRNVGRSRA